MTGEEFRRLAAQFSGHVIVDLGTGDGLFVYHRARKNPDHLHIGIDPNPRPLEAISKRIHRKVSKGGSPNLIYVQASAENLPEELQGTAHELYVLFPWGSLLKGVATADSFLLNNIRSMCAPAAHLHVLLSLDATTDQTEIKRLGLPGEIHAEYMKTLTQRYEAAGFVIQEVSWQNISELREFQTTWARKLRAGARRVLQLHANRKD